MLNNYIFFLDIGSDHLKGLIFNERNKKILAFQKEKSISVKNGCIINSELFQINVLNLIKKLELQLSIKIQNTVLLIGGKSLEYKIFNSNSIKIKNIINEVKMQQIENQVKQKLKQNNHILIKLEPISYHIDNLKVENPFGLYADELKFSYMIAYSNINQIGNTVFLLEKLNLNIIDIIPSAFCAGNKHLTYDEKILGSLIIELGSNSINWVYYFKNKIMNAGSSEIGMEKITYKIATSLKISLTEAEKIKKEYASAVLKSEHFCSWIKLNKNSNEEFILQSEMIRKILPEINLIFIEIKKIIDKFSSNKVYTISICSGGAMLNNFIEGFEKMTNLNLKTSITVEKEYDALLGAVYEYNKNYETKEKNIFQKIINWIEKNI